MESGSDEGGGGEVPELPGCEEEDVVGVVSEGGVVGVKRVGLSVGSAIDM